MRKILAALICLSFALATPALAAEEGAAKSGESADKQDKDKDKKKAEHKITQSVSYLEMEPIYASILDGSRPLGLLMLGIGLDVPNAQLREKADHDMPLLRDAYVRNMMVFAAAFVRPDEQPDVTMIADRLQGVTDRVLGRKGARILLAQVMIRLNK